MTDQTNVQPPKDEFPVIRTIGRVMFIAETGIFLLLGLLSAVSWLADIFG